MVKIDEKFNNERDLIMKEVHEALWNRTEETSFEDLLLDLKKRGIEVTREELIEHLSMINMDDILSFVRRQYGQKAHDIFLEIADHSSDLESSDERTKELERLQNNLNDEMMKGFSENRRIS